MFYIFKIQPTLIYKNEVTQKVFFMSKIQILTHKL